MTEKVATAPGGPRHAGTGPAGVSRGRALAGAGAGVAVVAVLIGVFAGTRGAHDSTPRPVAAAPPPAAAGPLSSKPAVTAGRGRLRALAVTPIVQGTGAPVRKGQTLTVNYLLSGYTSGREIESSWAAGGPVEFVIGVGRLIKGWDQGLPGQRVGSRLRLDVPAALAYGPAKGDLRFVVDILAAR